MAKVENRTPNIVSLYFQQEKEIQTMAPAFGQSLTSTLIVMSCLLLRTVETTLMDGFLLLIVRASCTS